MPCLCDRSSEVSRTAHQLPADPSCKAGPPRQQTRYPVGRRFLLAGRARGRTAGDSD